MEINLISAQGLQPPSSPRRRLQTYALTWIDPSAKLRTRVDKVGGHNPTWNDKFLFRVMPEFLISNILSSPADPDAARTPCFSAVQIRRQSRKFHSVMNIGVMVVEASDFPAPHKISAIRYRNLMGMKIKHHRRKRNRSPRRQR